jgi:hypothetical protein
MASQYETNANKTVIYINKQSDSQIRRTSDERRGVTLAGPPASLKLDMEPASHTPLMRGLQARFG